MRLPGGRWGEAGPEKGRFLGGEGLGHGQKIKSEMEEAVKLRVWSTQPSPQQ